MVLRQLQRAHRPWLLSWLFGLGWFGAGISWVHVSIAQFGGLPLVASLALMLLLCGYLAIYPMLALAVLKRYFAVSTWPLALPLLWTGSEWLRSWMLTGFPWLSLGYSAAPSVMSGWYAVIGETGVTTLLLVIAALLAQCSALKRCVPFALVTTVIMVSGAVLSHHAWTLPHQAKRYALVQGNIPQSLRWDPQQDKMTLQKYASLTAPHWQHDIIIWPEAAIPSLEPLATNFLQRLDKQAFDSHTALVTGIINFDIARDEAWNSIIVLGRKQPMQDQANYYYGDSHRYEKHHLLPIGEFVPFERWLRPLAPLFDLPMSSFSRGNKTQANLVANDERLVPALCFEIAFPRQISANVEANSGVILTLSNDAWFGDSHGPAQHLQIAQVRAAEFGRPVLRATNNGITAFIDDKGSVLSALPQFASGVLSATITSTKGTTPYGKWGDSLNLLMVVGLFAFALHRRRKPLTPSSPH